MIKNVKTSALLICITLAGCLHKSPRTDYQIWKKPGQTFEEIQAVMKSCGFRDPIMENNYTTTVKPMTIDERARYEICMYKKDYRKNFGMKSICEESGWKYYPAACREIDFIPPKPNP